MNLVVVGSGYVGLVSGACLADKGHRVICVDISEERIEGLKRGEVPIYEPGLDAIIARNADTGALSFTTSLPEAMREADIFCIAVGTPPDEDGSADSGIREIALGGAISGLVSFCANGLRVMADSASYWFKSGTAIFQLPMGYSLALLGAGFLVNLAGGIAILLGIAIAWGVLVPYFSSVAPQPADMDMASYALSLWKNKVRFIGAGTIGVAAIWTLITLLKPMMEGMRLSFKAMSGKHEQGRNRIDQDLGPRAMIAWSVGMLLMLGLGFHHFVDAASIPDGLGWLLVVVCTALAFFIGFLVAAACGYMAGLVGSSSSPISGIGIISVVIVSLVLLVIGESSNLFADEANRQFMVALTLFSGTAVIAVASVSNDNLQDLKTGWLVLTTGNKSELAVGYSTLYGDMAGGFAPLKDVLKTVVYQLSNWRNAQSPVIPERIITRPPSAELRPDQTDQDSLPPYDVLDRIIQGYMEQDRPAASLVAEGLPAEAVAQVVRLLRLAEYKRQQGPVGPRVTARAFGRDWRYPITSAFREPVGGQGA